MANRECPRLQDPRASLRHSNSRHRIVVDVELTLSKSFSSNLSRSSQSAPVYLASASPMTSRKMESILTLRFTNWGPRWVVLGFGTSKYLRACLPVVVTALALLSALLPTDVTCPTRSYPGCRCDIPAVNYTFSWSPKADWSEFYASSPEIREHFQEVVDKYVCFCHSSLDVRRARI